MRSVKRVAVLAMLSAAILGSNVATLAQSLQLPTLEPSLGTPTTLPVPTATPMPTGASPLMIPELPGTTPASPIVIPMAQPKMVVPMTRPNPMTIVIPMPMLMPMTGPMTVPMAQPMTQSTPTMQPMQQMSSYQQSGNGPGQDPGNPTGRQEPAVSIEWIGPSAAKVNQPADYSIMVRNVCGIAVQKVIVQVRMPQNVTVSATEPKAEQAENILMWEVGTLLPKQEKKLMVSMVTAAKGDLACQAWVTFTGSSVMRLQVREPKLLLKVTAPEKALVGDPAGFVLTVSNPGDYPSEQVKVSAALSEGLEHARGAKVVYDLGNLAAGETRSVQVLCITKAGGMQSCDVVAEADGGLKATDKATVNVIMPKIDVEIVGPKLRYLDRKATFVFKVSNPGDAPASNVTITESLPQGFKFISADHGGRHDFATRTVQWFVGEIAPGQSKEVKLECLAINPGEHQHKVIAQAARGMKSEAEMVTRVEGVSAILMELVDIEDPVEVGAETAYEIRVTNTGSKTETDVKLVCTVPPQMEFKSAQGPIRFQQVGSEIVFEPLPRLAPRADAIYRIVVNAKTKGDARFKAQLTSTNLTEPVVNQESTRIYED